MTENIWELNSQQQELIAKVKASPKAIVLTLNNFKGGVGKSTLINLFSYIMKKEKLKVLLVDSDPQRNLTTKLKKNFLIDCEPELSFMEGIKKNTLKKSISKLDDYIYLVEGDWE
ncbi:ParA family protein, partial [Lactococcus sp. dk322]|uniref:ParA family protein n=1 Tax=Lactococcus sp. dk322 TaxID=2603290 RepID=UPI0011C910B2